MKKKTMKKIIITLVLFEFIFLSINITLAKKINTHTEECIYASAEEQNILNQINNYRQTNGLNPLKFDRKLQELASLKANDLENNNYFSHTSQNLGTPFEMLKNNTVKYKIAGENLAGNINEEKAVDAWINSPSHRDNILEKDFEYTGISVIQSKTYGKIFVQLFIGL